MSRETDQSLWVRRARMARSPVFEAFAETIRALPIKEEDMRGDVLIGGQADAFPERVLLCSSDSKCQRMRPSVNSLTCCDPSLYAISEIDVRHPIRTMPVYGEMLPENGPTCTTEHVEYFPASLQEVLPAVRQATFDTAIFFRIVDMEDQLQEGLLTAVASALRSGGVFVGSGSFDSLTSAKRTMGGTLNIEALEELPNPDYSGFPYRTHLGFILRK